MGRDQPLRQAASQQASADGGRCPRCGAVAPVIYVHGHGQCAACGSNILDCCQGSDCDLAPGAASTSLP